MNNRRASSIPSLSSAFAALALLCAWGQSLLAQSASPMLRPSPLTLRSDAWSQPIRTPPPAQMPLIVARSNGPTYVAPSAPAFEPVPPPDIEPQMLDWPQADPPPSTLTFADAAYCCPPVPTKRSPGWRESLCAPAPIPWLAEPLSISKFAGGFGSDEPIEEQLKDGIGLITGLRFGWDFAPRWGVESRLAWARTSLGTPVPTGPVSHENFWIWDAAFCFYPLPDTQWRPFLFAGAGMTDVVYIDAASNKLHQSLFHIPLGFGIKRQIYGRHAFRIDVNDNLLFTDAQPHGLLHNVSITAGFELRFGGGWNWIHAGGRAE